MSNFTEKEIHKEIRKMSNFFILGRGRSGTTLLRFILDTHPNIIIPLDIMSKEISTLFNKYKNILKWDRNILLSFYNDLVSRKSFSYWNVDKEKLKNNLLECEGEEISFAHICNIVFREFTSVYEKNEIKIIGNKSPEYVHFTDELLEIFPDAKFIHITRDYRDNILSFYKVNFEAKIIASLAYRWKNYNKKICNFKQRYPDRFYTIKYEDLVNNPAFHINEICRFIGVEYHPSMLDYPQRAHLYCKDSPELLKIHKSLMSSSSINSDNVYKWRKTMKSFHIKMADMVVGKFAEEMGYERKYKTYNLLYHLIAFPGVIYGWSYCFIRFLANKNSLIKKVFYFLFEGNR